MKTISRTLLPRTLHLAVVTLVAACAGITASGCSDGETDCHDLANAGTAACAPASGAPKFAGVEHVAADAAGNFIVTWKPATDGKTAAEKMRYRVYVSRVKGRTLRQAAIESAAGATSTVVSVPQNEDLYVLVRAVNEANQEDGNIVEKKARSGADNTPPGFAGAEAAVAIADRGAKITWGAGTDDHTPPELLSYVVYGGQGEGIDYSKPLREVAAGTNELSLTKLGAPGERWSFVVIARDLAGNVSADKKVVSTPIGEATEPPTFAGCDTVTVVGKRVTVSWKPATSAYSESFTYQVYQSATSGGQDFANAVPNDPKALSLSLDVNAGGTFYFVCRATDAAGHQEQNKNEKSATISSDVTKPTFAGIDTATVDSDMRKVDLTWAAATDDVTPPNEMVYEVYERKEPTATFDFTAPPRAVSAPGATSITVDDLDPQATLHWVVRARDAAYNRDTNTVEKSGTTSISFARQIVPLMRNNCAVSGCHSSGFPAGGLSLSPALAYAATVNVNANQRPPGAPSPMKRVTPGDADQSYLYRKIIATPGTFVGSAMPAPGTGNVLSTAEKDLVKTWINSGALQN